MKRFFAASVVLNVALSVALIVVWGRSEWNDYQSMMHRRRLESVFRVSTAIHTGELDTTEWENTSSFVDATSTLCDYEELDEGWSCSIGPLHPTYGPWIRFDSHGALKTESEKEYLVRNGFR